MKSLIRLFSWSICHSMSKIECQRCQRAWVIRTSSALVPQASWSSICRNPTWGSLTECLTGCENFSFGNECNSSSLQARTTALEKASSSKWKRVGRFLLSCPWWLTRDFHIISDAGLNSLQMDSTLNTSQVVLSPMESSEEVRQSPLRVFSSQPNWLNFP